MSRPTTLPPPDITVTRDDVLYSLPMEHQDDQPGAGSVPTVGRSWHLVRFGPEDVGSERHLIGRLVWVDLPEGLPFSERDTVAKVMIHHDAAALTREGARNARAAFLWQTALASDAALVDIGRDDLPFGEASRPPTAGDVDRAVKMAIGEEVAAALRRITSGVKA